MATRGRKAKTAATSRPKAGETPPIPIPFHLEGRVRDEYLRVAAMLRESGKLEGTDTRLIELYAINYDLVRTAKEEIDRDGMTFTTERGAITAHPMIGVMNAATIRLRGLIADLTSVKAGAGSGDKSGGDGRWDGLLSITG